MRAASASALGAIALLLLWYLYRYGDCTAYFFHFDDFWLLGDASRVEHLGDIFRPGTNRFALYRPLSQVGYFWILRRLFGYDAAPYHAAQLLAHVFNSFLVYGVAAVVLRSRRLGFGAALVYAAAPGHVIAVYWNSLYSMTGAASWYLACVWVWMTGEGGASPRRGPQAGAAARSPARWLAAFALFLGALLSSEHAVSLPVALALASLLILHRPWRTTLRQLWPFFLVSFTYAAAKVAYMRYGLEADFGDPMAAALIRLNYGITVAPLESLRLLGFYTGCVLGWLYEASPEAQRWYAIGALMLALIALSAAWARAQEAGKRTLFGLLFFAATLGPVLLLKGHAYSYYSGISGAGIAIAVMAAAAAIPRLGSIAPGLLVILILAGELWTGEAKARANRDFDFFRTFQVHAARWIESVDEAARAGAGAAEVLVPRNTMTGLVFVEGRSHRLFLGAAYDVRLVPDLAAAKAPGVVVVERAPAWRRGNDYPGRQPRWDWLRGRDPWANG